MDKVFGECLDEFCESFGVYDGKSKPLNLNFIPALHFNFLCFSQRTIFFPSTTMKKTSGIGQIVSGRNISVKKMLKLRDGRRHLLDGRDRNAKKREPKKKKATRSSTGGCRRSTKSI